MKNKIIKYLKKSLCGVLCTAMAFIPAASVFATEYDETGAPIVTATPTPDPHTEFYDQAASTDNIPGWPQGPKIEGESAILVDMITGTVLYAKNADKVQYPASITKIMTLSCQNLPHMASPSATVPVSMQIPEKSLL